MLTNSIARINFSSKWLLIPLIVLMALTLGIGLLYAEKWTILIFFVVFVVVSIFAEPFIGALFYLICLYARPMEIIPAVKGMPIMKYLAIGTLGIWLLRIIVSKKRDLVKAPQNYLMIAFILVMAISMRTYVTGIVDVLTGDFFKIIIIYFLLINLVNTEKRLYITIWIIILSTLWLSIHSILLSRGIVIGDIELSQGTRVTSSGIFGDPNDLAQAIVVAVPFVFNLLFHERFMLKKIALAVIGATMLFAFLLTGSRGGFIGLSVVVFLLIRKKAGIIVGAVLSVAALLGLLVFAPGYMVQRLETASPYDDTGAARIEIWYEGWQMFMSNPILGVGMHNFAENESTGHVAHNSFVHVAAELGLPGLFIWMGLLYFSFRSLNEARKQYSVEVIASKAHVLSDSLIVSMVGFLTTSFFLSRQYEYLPYILIALSIVVYQVAGKDKGLKPALSMIELRNVLFITLAFFVVWFGILKVFL